MKLTINELQVIETEIVKEIAEICKRNNIDYFLHCGSALGAIRHGGPIPWDSDVDIIVPYNQYEKFIMTMKKELSEKFYLDYYDTNTFFTPMFPRIGLKGYSTAILHVDIFRLIGTSKVKKEQLHLTKKASFLSKIHYLKIAKEKYRGKIKNIKKISLFIYRILLSPISLMRIREEFNSLCNLYPYNKATYVTNPGGHYGVKNIVPKSYYGKGTYVSYAGIEAKIPEQYDVYLQHYYGDYMQLPPENERKVRDYYDIIEL